MSTIGQRPTKEALAGSRGLGVPDVIAPGLRVLFCGINPGLYSGAVGHHFARPGNRFWPVIFHSGFTNRLFAPAEERFLIDLGYGITNIVNRATARADELTVEDLRSGAVLLEQRILQYRPHILAILGLDAYRKAFGRAPVLGRQEQTIAKTLLWVLPNPSGINANYQTADLIELFTKLRRTVNLTQCGDSE
jgi:double-stranded uracil-DNA glycosylase